MTRGARKFVRDFWEGFTDWRVWALSGTLACVVFVIIAVHRALV